MMVGFSFIFGKLFYSVFFSSALLIKSIVWRWN